MTLRLSSIGITAMCLFLGACAMEGVPDTSSTLSTTSQTSSDPFECPPIAETPSATTTVPVTMGALHFDAPYNPAWTDSTGERLIDVGVITEEADTLDGLVTFGPLRFHSSMNGCAQDRDFSVQTKMGSAASLLAEYKMNYSGDVTKIVSQHIGSMNTIVVPAPEAVCPSPMIIVLGADAHNYQFSLSCEGLKHYEDPLQELRNIVKTAQLTKKEE